MNLLYPALKLAQWRQLALIALAGALAAGLYGIIHDQITYAISPEYFTRLKFTQFHGADFGWPRLVYVSEIGFLATWWVGFFAAWFLGRIAVPAWPPALARRRVTVACALVFALAMLAGATGNFLAGRNRDPENYVHWRGLTTSLGVVDVPAFVRVAYIHNGGYLGGLAGLVAGVVYLLGMKRQDRQIPPT